MLRCSQCNREFAGTGRQKFCSAECKARHAVNERRSWRRIVSHLKRSGLTLDEALANRNLRPNYPPLSDVGDVTWGWTIDDYRRDGDYVTDDYQSPITVIHPVPRRKRRTFKQPIRCFHLLNGVFYPESCSYCRYRNRPDPVPRRTWCVLTDTIE